MKSLSRILSGIGAVTLCVAACNDKDISLIAGGDGGMGGSTPGVAGSGGSSSGGNGGSGTSGSAGLGGGGAGGNASAGSAGQGNAGTSSLDPDAGDSGPPPGPYADICQRYCAVRTAWATATTDGGVNCAGWDAASCQGVCESEAAGFLDPPPICSAWAPATECHISANVWYCQDNSVFPNSCAGSAIPILSIPPHEGCTTTCDTEATAFNVCLGF
ncbi:MAG: hypothetical protein RL685_7513 [Pseudomonadota bacterium]